MDAQELRFEAADDLEKFMSLDELEEKFSGKRVEFAVEKGEVEFLGLSRLPPSESCLSSTLCVERDGHNRDNV